MQDFKSYRRPDDGRDKAQNAARAGGFNGNSGSASSAVGGVGDARLNDTVELVKLFSAAMNGKSASEILSTVIAEAERGKRAGTLTNADLDNFYSSLSPFLDGIKRKKLRQVINRLKEI